MTIYKKVSHPERPFVLHIVVGVPSKELTHKLNRTKKKIKPLPPDYFAQDERDEALTHDISDYIPGHFVIYFNHPPLLDVIIHESFHCVAQHFRYIGQPLDENSEESYAYMLDWLTTKIIKAVKV